MRTKLFIGVAALVAATLLPLATATAAGGRTPALNQANVTVANSPYGQILVLGAGAGCTSPTSCLYPPGSTLYMASVDPPPYKTPRCGTTVVNDTVFGPLSCTGKERDPSANWPALTTTGPPIAGNGVVPGLLSVLWRTDLNSFQVTYDGHPLYLNEPGAGNYTGANAYETVLPLPPWHTAWYLVSPLGLPAAGPATLETEAPQPGTTYSSTQLAVEMLPNAVPNGAAAVSAYSFSLDSATHSACYALCMRLMIPVYTVGTPIAGTGVNAGAIGTIMRPNGAQQVTYNGKPLYIYGQEQPLTGSSGLLTTGTAGNGQGVTAKGGPLKDTGTFSLVTPFVGTPGNPVAVPGSSVLAGVACPTGTTCEAVGSAPLAVILNQGAVVPITEGTPGSVVLGPGNSTLGGVACTSATMCEAVGAFQGNPFVTSGQVVPITNGTPGSGAGGSDTFALQGVACPSATFCEAVGLDTSLQGAFVPVTNGTPGSTVVVPGTGGLSGLACPSATICEAVGTNGTQGVVVPITNGTPGSPVAVPGTSALAGVACPSATICEAVGSNGSQGVVVPLTDGTPGSPVAVPGTSALAGVACPSATICEAVGTNGTQGVAVTLINGTPGSAVVVSGASTLAGVACPNATTCEAVGSNPSQDQGVVVPIT